MFLNSTSHQRALLGGEERVTRFKEPQSVGRHLLLAIRATALPVATTAGAVAAHGLVLLRRLLLLGVVAAQGVLVAAVVVGRRVVLRAWGAQGKKVNCAVLSRSACARMQASSGTPETVSPVTASAHAGSWQVGHAAAH